MAAETTIDLASLRFEGERFDSHALDVECGQELIAYRRIVLECAKELWRRKHPARERLPKRFEDSFRIQFDRLEPGSTLVPLRRVIETDQTPLDFGIHDEFDEAAQLIDAAIAAANDDTLLPESFPSNVVPLFREFGRTMRDDEVLFTCARHRDREAAYTVRARKRLADWVGSSYEDVVEVVGEVQMASVKGQFLLLVANGAQQVAGKFTPEQEAEVLEALRQHRTLQLRVRGVGEFGTHDRMLRRFNRVDSVSHLQHGPQAYVYVEDAPDVWAELDAIAAKVPAEAWDVVPRDLSLRVDELIYGHGEAAK
jgi:hypothetical protein